MILLVDIGNSRTKFATMVGAELKPGKAQENSESFNAMFEALAQPNTVYVSCVGREALYESLVIWVEQQWGCHTIRLHTQQRCGKVVNGYAQPERLGVDRWAALVAAYQLVKGAALVIDCGTVCTADLIDAEGRHLGGAMMPGRGLLQQALNTGTAAIDTVPVKGNDLNWGTNTAGCMVLGIEAGLLGFIEKMVQMTERTLEQSFEIVLTGGDAAALQEQCGNDVRYEKELVFYGMAAMVAERG